MESFLNCDICMENYDEKERIPKSLRCGHSLCSLCLPNIGDRCPSCRQKVPTAAAAVPTNFSLLSLLGININQLPKENIEIHAKKLEEMLLTKKGVIEDDLKEIRQILSAESCSMSDQEKKDLLNEIKERHSDTNESERKQDPNCLLLEKFRGTKEFLSRIKRLLKAGKRVFACHKSGHHLQYGEVVFHEEQGVWCREEDCLNDLLLMNSLSESQVEEGAAVILYSDLQKCLTSNNFSIHLLFRNGREEQLFVFRPNESRILPQLIQLCTGEKGPTYKGAKFSGVQKGKKDCEVSLLKYVVDGVPTQGIIDPYAIVGLPKGMDREDIPDRVWSYIEMNDEGQLTIFEGPRNKTNELLNLRNRHEAVFYSRLYFGDFFWNNFEGYVVDCGIAIQV